ncbi:alcohol dehydrogenase [Aphelenchoides bicaudatus]|nr:alcohol dehydrogenase [Aphelenchoides bicaudatus]
MLLLEITNTYNSIKTMSTTHLTLSNGVKMPIVGLGTWQAKEGQVAVALRQALNAGYRLIDTAAAYGNEKEIGEVLKQEFAEGTLKREDVFVTTKLFWAFNREEEVESQLRQSLKNLQLDYVDLYLVHMPGGLTADCSAHDNSQPLQQLWRGMEKVYNLKLTRSIGLSNANAEQVQRVQSTAKVPVHNNQVELHLLFNQRELQKVHDRLNITLTAYAPIGSPGRVDMTLPGGKFGFYFTEKHSSALEHPLVLSLAKKYSKTPAQILLRQLTQRGISVIFDFQLTEEEVGDLLNVEQEPRIFKLEFLDGSAEDPIKDERQK